MKILNVHQIREADAYTIANEPIASIDLMERASAQCARWIANKIDKHHTIHVFAGPGNNGGDGLAIARLLHNYGFTLKVYVLKLSKKVSADTQINLERLRQNAEVPVIEITGENSFPKLNANDYVIDALFGSGLSRPLYGLTEALVLHINKSGCQLIAIDIPSGLFADSNLSTIHKTVIKANDTLTFQQAKLAFLFPENEVYTGHWHVLNIGLSQAFIASCDTTYNMLQHSSAQALLKKRTRFSHKGNYGHALLVAGSYGMMGAAVLAARAGLHSGVGLLTAHVPRLGCDILQTAVPEVMLSIDQSDILFSGVENTEKYNAIAVGPAIGTRPNTKKALKQLLQSGKVPMVLDADALNIVSEHNELLSNLNENTILTPHVKEFSRLAGASVTGEERLQLALEFAHNHKLVVVLKGAYTAVIHPQGSVSFNVTGNPGMATGGSGDVLTGVILALLAQGYSAFDAARLAVYLHGLAGDLAAENLSEEGVIASDIINYLPHAIKFTKS